MKKIFVLVIIISIFMIIIPNTYAWGGPSNEIGTHYQMTSFAFDYIAKYFKFILDFKLFNDEYINIIKDNSYYPDIFEKRKGTHYYVYKEEEELYHKNRYGQIQKSAKFSFEEHYMMAIYLFKDEKYNASAASLGKAIHYLEDMTCPVHTLGISGREFHHNFESYVTKNISQFLGYINPNYENDDICEYASKKSSDDKYKESIYNYNWDLIANEMIPFGIGIVVELLKKFIDDVLKDYPTKVLLDNEYRNITSTKKGFIIGNGKFILDYKGRIRKTIFKKYHRIALVKNNIRISIGRKYIKSLKCDMSISDFKDDDNYLFEWR